MVGRTRKDAIDRIILGKFSLYENLAPLELWYEVGEHDVLKESVTEEEKLI